MTANLSGLKSLRWLPSNEPSGIGRCALPLALREADGPGNPDG